MTRFKLPRYESSDAIRAAELHDAAMDRLVAEHAARRDTAGTQTSDDDSDAIPAPVDPLSRRVGSWRDDCH